MHWILKNMALRGCTRKVSSFLQVQSRCLRKSIKTQPSFSGINAYNLHHLSFYRENWIHILVVCCLGIKRIILLLALCVCREQKSPNWWHNILALNEVSCIVLVPLIKWTTPNWLVKMKNCQNDDFQFTLLDLASVKSLFLAWLLKSLHFSTYNLYFSTSFYLIGKLV